MSGISRCKQRIRCIGRGLGKYCILHAFRNIGSASVHPLDTCGAVRNFRKIKSLVVCGTDQERIICKFRLWHVGDKISVCSDHPQRPAVKYEFPGAEGGTVFPVCFRVIRIVYIAVFESHCVKLIFMKL